MYGTVRLRAYPRGSRVSDRGLWRRWILLDGFEFVDYSRTECFNGGGRECTFEISRNDATLYFGVLLLVAGVPSVLTFRRRDVP